MNLMVRTTNNPHTHIWTLLFGYECKNNHKVWAGWSTLMLHYFLGKLFSRTSTSFIEEVNPTSEWQKLPPSMSTHQIFVADHLKTWPVCGQCTTIRPSPTRCNYPTAPSMSTHQIRISITGMANLLWFLWKYTVISFSTARSITQIGIYSKHKSRCNTFSIKGTQYMQLYKPCLIHFVCFYWV